jgi:hypothetical protein
VIVSGTSLDSGHDMASRRRFSFKTADDSLPKSRMARCSKKSMALCQNRWWLFAKTADGSLPKPLMALCQNRWWLSAKTADGSGGGL